FLDDSLRLVNRNSVNPSCWSILCRLKLAGRAGALANSVHSSKVVSSKASDLSG
ncbi:hypothetical protein Ancab_028518, partial [Ancistrocladus abbreviatus]